MNKSQISAILLTIIISMPIMSMTFSFLHFQEIRSFNEDLTNFKNTQPDYPGLSSFFDPNINWIEIPTDQLVQVDTNFRYDLNATTSASIDHWWLNDTSNFDIDTQGVITNATVLSVRDYGLQVWVNDTDGDELSANFTVTVSLYSIFWDEWPIDQIVEYDTPFRYDLNASSVWPIDQWWLTDELTFSIDDNGVITNATVLSLDNHLINVFVNNTDGETISAFFYVSVRIFNSWTVLVYLDGDNDLEEYAFSDFNSMEEIGSTSEVKIIVYVDFYEGTYAPYTSAKCYEITQDFTINQINSIELSTPLPIEPNMGNYATLRDFIIFGQSYAPAHHFMLVLWDHGRGYTGVCSDYTSYDSLKMFELELALEDPAVKHFDIIAFDACLMGQLEVAYQIRDYTDLFVFSEEGIPVYGYPYENILLNLTTWPDMGPWTLAEDMVNYYIEAYDVGGIYYPVGYSDICLSAVEASGLDALVTALDDVAFQLIQNVTASNVYDYICQSLADTQSFDDPRFVDLGEFATNLRDKSSSLGFPYLESLASQLLTAIQSAVYTEGHLSWLPDVTGLAIATTPYQPHSLALAGDTHWNEFIEAFVAVGETSSTACLIEANAYYGYLDDLDDYCYFEFIPNTSGTYKIILDALWDEQYHDFDLYLYNQYNYEIASSTTSESYEILYYYLTAGETFYIAAHSWSGSDLDGVSPFLLYVTIDSPFTPPIPIDPIILSGLIGIGLLTFVIILVAVLVTRRSREPEHVPYPYSPTPARTPPSPRSEQPQRLRFCAYCGAVTPLQARYCPVCGASLDR